MEWLFVQDVGLMWLCLLSLCRPLRGRLPFLASPARELQLLCRASVQCGQAGGNSLKACSIAGGVGGTYGSEGMQ